MIEKKIPVNQDVKVIVKKKAQKYNGANSQSNNFSETGKVNGMWISPRQRNFHPRYKPIWQDWGMKKANPKGELGFIANKHVFGNDKKGKQWVEEQKKRQEQDIFQPGQIPQIQEVEQDQIIYVEPSVSEARLKRLRQMGRTFTDDGFPPEQKALSGVYGPQQDWQTLKWRRVSYAIQNTVIFDSKIQPSDIKQGFLGDCYFLAGLAALAERPDRIFNLFLLKEKNDMNYYSMRILYRGKWRSVDVDDYVPFAFNMPAFGRSEHGQLWVIMLEKAWAKIYGCYKQIQAGFPQEPLHDLTGAPIKHIFLVVKGPKYDEQWNYLLEASQKQYSMVASSKPGSDTNKSNSGIYQGHAYTFLNATILSVQGQEYRLVQLRNPWGKGEYKGKWSDGDPAWNKVSESQKRRVFKDTQIGDDGIFFMGYEAFVNEFRNITVAEIDDNASYVYESFYDPDIKGAYFTIHVSKSSSYSFQVDKTPERSFTGDKQYQYRYPEGWLEIGKIQGNKVKRYEGFISSRRTLFKTYDLQPGKYVAWVRIKFDPQFQQDFEINLAVYSLYAVGIKLATRDEAVRFQDGDTRIEWTGEKNTKQSIIKPTPPPSNISKPEEQSKKQVFINFFGGGDNSANPQSLNQIKKTPSTIHNESGNIPSSSMRKKKIRTIQVHHKRVEITEQNEQGQGIVTVEQTQVRKETLKTKQDTGENIKQKEHHKKIDSTEHKFQGQTVNKKEKQTQTLKTRQIKPTGEIIEKVQTQEHEMETMEIDDESNGSVISQLKQQTPVRQVKYSEVSSLTNQEQNNKTRAIKQNLQKERRNRDQLRYQQPDSESNTSEVAQRK